MLVEDVFKTISNLNIERGRGESVAISQALGRVLASDVAARKDLPAYDNSALDGYAFAYAERDKPLSVKGEIFAGDKARYKINSGECYKIMTGAIFPNGADTVVPVEDEKFDETGRLLVDANVKEGNARKIRGEEVRVGDVILERGRVLKAADIMFLASQGISYAHVCAAPRIAIFSTGDEINEPWESCDERGIYNANAFGLAALLKSEGFESEYKGILRDDPEAIKAALKECSKYDIVLTSGGASKGDADYMRSTLSNLNYREIFAGIDVRPAKPTKLFEKDGQFVCIMPGNPMSCMVGCFLSVLPLAKKLSGAKQIAPQKITATLAEELNLKPTRATIVPGIYKNGEFFPINHGKFSPAMIKILSNADALFLSKVGDGVISAGSKINFYKI